MSRRIPATHVGRLTFCLDPQSPVQRQMREALGTEAGYEPGVTWAIRHTLGAGDVAVDIGAHVGVLACQMAERVGPSGRVHAFEPNRENRAALLRHVRANGVPWCKVDKRAVSETAGPAPFYECADNDGGHALWNPANGAANVLTKARPRQSPVTCVRLDDALPADRPVRLIKCDTEGAECGVFRGAVRILAHDRPVVIAEVNWFGLQQMGESEQNLRAIFRQYGYAEGGLQDQPPFIVPIAPDHTLQTERVEHGICYLPVFNMIFWPAETPLNTNPAHPRQ